MTHVPGVCECVTCGYPCLRPEGHADWCARLNGMSAGEVSAATVAMADAKGLRNLDNGTRYYRTLPNSASSSDPRGSAAADGSGEHGAFATSGAPRRPAAPTTRRRPAARTAGPHEHAG